MLRVTPAPTLERCGGGGDGCRECEGGDKSSDAAPTPTSNRDKEPHGSKQACDFIPRPQNMSEAKKLAMEHGYPCNGCGGNKEKRPPLKRGQLKVQIVKTLLGSLAVPAGAGAANRERSFGR
uniref:Uncharacterized protein n=3 Tax=Zea mays TaxID=4577 RepID=A0A804NBA0_MAIZE